MTDPGKESDMLPSEEFRFNSKFYTKSYPDLSHMNTTEALGHFNSHGFRESRYCSPYHYLAKNFPLLKNSFNLKHFLADNPEFRKKRPLRALSEVAWLLTAGFPSERDHSICSLSATKEPEYAKHGQIWKWIAEHYSKPGVRVLEIGSRAVCSDSFWKHYIPDCTYTGFDVLPGKNVDVVGDAHKLSDYFSPNSFDLVVSFAVFEHLAMPWIVAEEISRVVRPDGHVVLETHFSYSEHELPWHFFQFNANALQILFNSSLGFTTVDSGHDNPIIGRFSSESSMYLRGKPVTNLYCHSSIITQKTHEAVPGDQHNWRSSLASAIGDTMYPRPQPALVDPNR